MCMSRYLLKIIQYIDMQSCCLIGCESYKFPLHDQQLLQKWLNQIRIPDWIPTDAHQICSTHFHIDDIDFTPRFPILKRNAVPIIFPLKHFQHIYVNDAYSSSVTSTKIRQAIQRKTSNYVYTKYSTNGLSINHNEFSDILGTCNNEFITPTVETSTTLSIKPFNVFVISRFKEKKIQTPLLEMIQKNEPVLKIEIDKIRRKKCDENFCSCSNINKIYSKDSIADNLSEDIQIEDVSASKLVIFKLNRSTGEIKILKRDKPRISPDSKIFVLPKAT